MKCLKKFFALALAVMLVTSLVTTASAATGGTRILMAPPLTSTGEDTETVPLTVVSSPDIQWLYWANYLGTSKPEIYYDDTLKQAYLAFPLDDASKLAELLDTYRYAFALQDNLERLIKMNDVDEAIWEKPDWREKSIGEQLSKSTAAALKALDDIDAYAALKLIQTRPEYDSDETLQNQVDYHLAMMRSEQRDVLNGLNELDSNNRPVELSEVTAEPADTIELAEKFLKNHPKLAVLDEVRDLALSGYTSKYTTTFHTADADIADLWSRVCDATSTIWTGELQSLDTFRFAVPFPEGTVYQWPKVRETPVENPTPTERPGTSVGN